MSGDSSVGVASGWDRKVADYRFDSELTVRRCGKHFNSYFYESQAV